jgi:hypothetical protein
MSSSLMLSSSTLVEVFSLETGVFGDYLRGWVELCLAMGGGLDLEARGAIELYLKKIILPLSAFCSSCNPHFLDLTRELLIES